MNYLVKQNTNGVVMTSSRRIAEVFGKEHKNVIRNIEKILKENVDSKYHIKCSSYYDKRRAKRTMYLLDNIATKMYIDKCRNTTDKCKLIDYYNNYFDNFNNLSYNVYTRPELKFGEVLNILFPNEKIFKQYSVLNYKLDFFFPRARIIIEYDEEQHLTSKNKIKDRNREIEILQKFKNDYNADFMFVRIIKGKEIEGIRNLCINIAKMTNLSCNDFMN